VRFLLVAYDFPPTPSPQALRWAYLSRELAAAGHEVQVLTPDVAGYGPGGLGNPPGVERHPVFPGPFMGTLSMRARRKAESAGRRGGATAPSSFPHAGNAPRLNWKGRMMERVKAALSFFMFPDIRAEWGPWARRSLDRLLVALEPDIVVTSHEPANVLPLGLRAKRSGYRWIADLGDPVLAPYTPRRWRERAFALERQVCESADAVSVTNDGLRGLLVARHGIPLDKVLLLPQGYDQAFGAAAEESTSVGFESDLLEALYTGSFYRFRSSSALVHAVLQTPGMRLNIATPSATPELIEAAERHPDRIRMLGFVPHRMAMSLQRRSDLLLNIANDDPVQVPGKLFEYLGSGTPILHIGGGLDDESCRVVTDAGAGWCVGNDVGSIVGIFSALVARKKLEGGIGRPTNASFDIERYSWRRLAAEFAGRASQCLLPTPEARHGAK